MGAIDPSPGNEALAMFAPAASAASARTSQPAQVGADRPRLLEEAVASGRYRDESQARVMLLAEHFGVFDDAKAQQVDDGFVSQGDLERVRDNPQLFGEDVAELAGHLLETLPGDFPDFPGEDVSIGQVAERIAGEAPPVTAGTSQAGEFAQQQIATIAQAASLGHVDSGQADAWLETVFAGVGPLDATQAIALVDAADQQDVPPALLLTVIEHVTRDLAGTQLEIALDGLAPVFGRIAERLHDGDPGNWSQALDRLYATARDLHARSGSAGQAMIIQSIASAYPDYDRFEYVGGLYSEEVADLGFNQALIAGFDAVGNTSAAGVMRVAMIDHVRGLHDSAADARETCARHEAMLAADLAAFGPGMTDAERADYTEGFWAVEAHANARDAAATADADLANALEHTSVELERMAAAGDHDAARLLHDGYSALALSPAHARQTLDFMERVFDRDATALFDTMFAALGEGFAEAPLTAALASLQATLVAEASASGADDAATRTMLEEFRGYVETFKDAKDAFAAFKKGFRVPEALDNAVDGLYALGEYLSLDPVAGADRRAELVAQFSDKQKQPGPFQGLMAVAGMLAAGNNLRTDPSWENFLAFSRTSLESSATAMGVLARAGKLVSVEDAASFSKFADRIVPWISLVINTTEFARQLGELDTAGDVIRLTGLGVNIVGDLVSFIPFAGTALKGVLTGVGAGLVLIGDVVDSIINGNRERDAVDEERRRLLDAAGIDALQIDRMIDNPALYSALGKFGLEPVQVDAAATRLIESNGHRTNDLGPWLSTLTIIASYGLQGEDALLAIELMTDLFDSAGPQGVAEAAAQGFPSQFFLNSAGVVLQGGASVEAGDALAADVREGWPRMLSALRSMPGQAPDPDPLMELFNSGQGEPNAEFFLGIALLSSGER